MHGCPVDTTHIFMSECGRVISVVGERVSGQDGEGGGAGAGGGEWPYRNRQGVARRRSRCPRTDGRAAMGGGDEGPCRYHEGCSTPGPIRISRCWKPRRTALSSWSRNCLPRVRMCTHAGACP